MDDRALALIDRFSCKPLALLPSRAPALLDALRTSTPRMSLGFTTEGRPRLYDIVDGVAVIPIHGVLLHGETWWWDTMSYGCIAQCISEALADAEARAIVLHVDSPGGEVAGCFDLADSIYEARGIKPIVAIVDESAYSAAYAIASSADQVIVPRSGGTGSIGVIGMHVDITAALEQSGVKVTTIQFGARKSDSYSTTPLSDEARARMQDDIDALGEIFVALVARNRGIAADAVRGMEAATFLGQAGVDAGLADAVMATDDAFLALVEQVASRP